MEIRKIKKSDDINAIGKIYEKLFDNFSYGFFDFINLRFKVGG